ncbi:MAG TPA: H-type lectin domain-containing protein [Stellaceae bacterium]|nr:H-type lectin domain-containing protein [Stellaceae bacterium]
MGEMRAGAILVASGVHKFDFGNEGGPPGGGRTDDVSYDIEGKFLRPPEVTLGIVGLDVLGDGTRIYVQALSITETGFSIDLSFDAAGATDQAVLNYAFVQWLAIGEAA